MADTIFLLAMIYACVGVLFAVFFAVRGVVMLDPVAKGSPWTFRLLILPGAVALWPVLAAKLWRRKGASP